MPQELPDERSPVNAPAAPVPSRFPTPEEASREPPHIPDHELLRRIGVGSYGEVWLARSVMGTLRAVKFVYRKTFENERPYEREYAGIQKFEPVSRSHEGFVDILQIGRNDEAGYFYYVMELAESVASNQCSVISNQSLEVARTSGSAVPLNTDPLITDYSPRTLRREISRRARLPVDECVALGLSLARALAHLHAQGLVHRDIKPSNIIFVGGVPKLADIGLVTDVGEARSYVGTEGFIPPEGPGTPAADLFSLGKVLYEASTGKDRQDFPEPLTNLGDQPDKDRLLELNAIMHKACATNTRQRYQTADELHADLAVLQRGESVKRKRAIQRRWTIARKLGLACALVAALIAAVPFKSLLIRGKAPNPEAVRLFELGQWYHNQFTEEGQTKAILYLNQAVQIEPKYVEAYRLLFEINLWSGASEDKKKSSRELAAKLMALDPNLAEAHAALSLARHEKGDWSGAEHEIQTAIKLNPNYSEARCLYGYYLCLSGRVEEAIPQMQRARELDPTSRLHATSAGFPFIVARQYDLAIAQFGKALELDPNFALAHLWIGKALEAKGEYLEALREFEKNAVFSGVDERKARQRFDQIRQAYASAGPRGYWLKALEFTLAAEASHETPKVSEQDRWSLEGIYAQLGEMEKALDMLEKRIKEGDYGSVYWVNLDPLYVPLHEEPRFRAMLEKLGLQKQRKRGN
ncbi:MAG TPA: tetratricopeptide repeat protein [Verrucomicrobiae bacterium]|nr:tetratricopeptide repeat protein [Verrucomicrobiae bacterium]